MRRALALRQILLKARSPLVYLSCRHDGARLQSILTKGGQDGKRGRYPICLKMIKSKPFYLKAQIPKMYLETGSQYTYKKK